MIRSRTIRVAGVTVAGLSIAVTEPEIIVCDGKGQVKPSEIILVCRDGNTFVSNIKWKKWNDNRATGTGTLSWNTCLPETCVAGIVQTY